MLLFVAVFYFTSHTYLFSICVNAKIQQMLDKDIIYTDIDMMTTK